MLEIFVITTVSAVFAVLISCTVYYFLNNLSQNTTKRFFPQLLQKCISDRLFFLTILAATTVITVLSLHQLGINRYGLLALLFGYTLITLTFIDLRSQMLPDPLTKPLIAAGICINYFEIFTTLQHSLIGAFLGYFILWSVNTLFRIVRKKEGMGYGDFKLLAAIGAWAGAPLLPLVIVLSSFMGIIFALITLKAKGQDASHPVPFGPSLSLAGFICLIYGNSIINAYMGLLH